MCISYREVSYLMSSVFRLLLSVVIGIIYMNVLNPPLCVVSLECTYNYQPIFQLCLAMWKYFLNLFLFCQWIRTPTHTHILGAWLLSLYNILCLPDKAFSRSEQNVLKITVF